ncbi:MAG: hypothetical protein JWN53_2394, partial [Gemmatimonadetes bacterium]|nr:hypothetical protein [Gemmatimonadota bacterium]
LEGRELDEVRALIRERIASRPLVDAATV